MKKLLILLLVLSSCVVKRYTCDPKCVVTPIVAFTPGAVTNLPFLETKKAGPVMVNKWDVIADEADKATKELIKLPNTKTNKWDKITDDADKATKNKLIIKQ